MSTPPSADYVPNAYHLPPDMVLLPDGERMSVDAFFREHSTQLCQYQDAKIGVFMPAQHLGDDINTVLKGSVGALAGWLATLVFPESVAGKVIGGGLGAEAGAKGADFIAEVLDNRARLKIIKVRDFYGCR